MRRARRGVACVRSPLATLRARLGQRWVNTLFELFFAVVALSSAVPLFAARYLPIQDLPQHAAAVRVLFDYADPELGFRSFFERSPLSTQYLSVYALAGLMRPAFDSVVAIKLVLAASLVALPYAFRAALCELGKPGSYALLTVPLAYNAHLILGFINFLAALPLLFAGIALALDVRRRASLRGRIALALVALLCFYTHVVPYGMLCLAVFALSATLDARRLLRALAPLAPSMLAALIWLATNPAGRAVASLATNAEGSAGPVFLSLSDALQDLPRWFTDVFHTRSDERAFLAWLSAFFAVFLLGAARRARTTSARASARRRLAGFVPLAALGYFVMPAAHDFIWPIHARFAWLALLFAVLATPRVARSVRVVLALFASGLALQTSVTAWRAFDAADQTELRGLNTMVAAVPPGSRVAGLIFSRTSRFVRFAPYLHAVAWVQAECGGAVEFSFAEFPHSPFRFREDNRPPHISPRWEWRPDLVDPAADLGWFDYVLTRGGRPLLGFRRVAASGAWTLWRR